jgi:hypothetical protein
VREVPSFAPETLVVDLKIQPAALAGVDSKISSVLNQRTVPYRKH